jgi:hypothetical protein
VAETSKTMISIWLWVGIILGVYGLIVLATGVAAIGSTNEIVVRGHNPALWWGAIMTLAGIVFTVIGRLAGRGN